MQRTLNHEINNMWNNELNQICYLIEVQQNPKPFNDIENH
jgi:hypothetical protein